MKFFDLETLKNRSLRWIASAEIKITYPKMDKLWGFFLDFKHKGMQQNLDSTKDLLLKTLPPLILSTC